MSTAGRSVVEIVHQAQTRHVRLTFTLGLDNNSQNCSIFDSSWTASVGLGLQASVGKKKGHLSVFAQQQTKLRANTWRA